MQRNRNVSYDDDELYLEDEEAYAEDGGDGYTNEDRENFANLTPVVRAALEGVDIEISDLQIEEALWHYYWDVGKSVAYLKNTTSGRKPQQQQPSKKEKPKSKFDEAAQRNAENTGRINAKTAPDSGLAQKTAALKLDAAHIPASPQVKNRSKGLDVPRLWAEEKSNRKPSAAFVVIGHVDHGKSTLMGRLLLDTGAVSQRDVDKYKKQATELGKASFALAWVMDTGSEERERGVTVDIAQHHFSAEKVDFTILDAPGHQDFVPNMIGGASMADFAVLVVDANQLESGMKGQTQEHIILAHAVGIRRLVVAVNKLDSTHPPWSEKIYQTVCDELVKSLKQTGFAQKDVAVVPCSGLLGENVVKPPKNSSELAWVSKLSKTLLQALCDSATPAVSEEQVKGPVRMQIADVFRGGVTNPLSVSGRMSSGNLQAGDVVKIQPSGELATIKAVEVNGQAQDWAVAGSICTLHLADIEPQHIHSGDILCSSSHPVTVVKGAVVEVQALASLLPQGVDIHLGRLHAPGTITQLIATLDSKEEVLRRRPRMIKAGQKARLKLALSSSIPLEPGDRVVLRADGNSVAAGGTLEVSK